MNKLTWYASRQERSEATITILMDLIRELHEPNTAPLRELFAEYVTALSDESNSILIILNRLQLDSANCLIHHNITLTKENQARMQQIRKLSEIRYGN
ncbi:MULTISPECIES: bacteriocin immunity protein [Enterococcus]|uniref:Bacteriocin immunity protein n=1 Tax=Enterococcus sulfureus ATCC 49903 TaxID=1140003 RepID=S0KSI2_9ENTE|nr:bacteriocin immunity protein [Enterococcus sulfureus]EOT47612.1 hypothetical protein OMY_00986 [Enterococcus sulfureus ATCC 49903]EOT83967.1 hypothetical protein I573_01692 [Enterococcus sulfureus ATCC 49903]